MKPVPFRFACATTREEANRYLLEYQEDAKLLAGGQSLLPLMNLRLATPRILVDITRVGDLNGIAFTSNGVEIGATTRHRDVERSSNVCREFGAIADALPLLGHVAIRNVGTVGGSVAHADPAAEWPALLLAFEAILEIESAAGPNRSAPAEGFFTGWFSTALRPEEMLTKVRLPPQAPGTGSALVEIARRRGDFALAGSVAVVNTVDGRISDSRIALMGASDTPIRARAAEEAIRGMVAEAATFEAGARVAQASSHPVGDVHADGMVRSRLLGVAVRRSLALAASRAGGRDAS